MEDTKVLEDFFLNRVAMGKNAENILKKTCLCFVYNSMEKLTDEAHKSECIYPDEIIMIENAFHNINKLTVLKYDSEVSFINDIENINRKFTNILVYSMAQDICGEGRRCLIPLLCEYFGFKNISSDAASSFLGGNKDLMFNLLSNKNICMPQRNISSVYNEKALGEIYDSMNKIIVKPYNESASIGINVFECNKNSRESFLNYAKQLLLKYKKIIIEEFVQGEEVECTLFKIGSQIVASPLVKIIKQSDYLDYNTVRNNDYEYELYSNNSLSTTIINSAKKCYEVLNFNSIARFDYIVNDNVFLFDITPNPTISELSTSNISIKSILGSSSCIYTLLVYLQLFIPTLDK